MGHLGFEKNQVWNVKSSELVVWLDGFNGISIREYEVGFRVCFSLSVCIFVDSERKEWIKQILFFKFLSQVLSFFDLFTIDSIEGIRVVVLFLTGRFLAPTRMKDQGCGVNCECEVVTNEEGGDRHIWRVKYLPAKSVMADYG